MLTKIIFFFFFGASSVFASGLAASGLLSAFGCGFTSAFGASGLLSAFGASGLLSAFGASVFLKFALTAATASSSRLESLLFTSTPLDARKLFTSSFDMFNSSANSRTFNFAIYFTTSV